MQYKKYYIALKRFCVPKFRWTYGNDVNIQLENCYETKTLWNACQLQNIDTQEPMKHNFIVVVILINIEYIFINKK